MTIKRIKVVVEEINDIGEVECDTYTFGPEAKFGIKYTGAFIDTHVGHLEMATIEITGNSSRHSGVVIRSCINGRFPKRMFR